MATVIDLFFRRVVGWSMTSVDHLSDAEQGQRNGEAKRPDGLKIES